MSIIITKSKGIVDPNQPHLGGNSVEINPHTFCPSAWSYVIKKYNIKSMLDVGSGRGHAPNWFKDQGVNAFAIEGLDNNVVNAIYPTELVDLTKSSYKADVDLVHCVEVVEHIDEKFLDNLLTTMCNGKYLFMTHGVPGQKGHHHVNNQPTQYWIDHLDDRGFYESVEDSIMIKELAKQDKATHIIETGMLFIRK